MTFLENALRMADVLVQLTNGRYDSCTQQLDEGTTPGSTVYSLDAGNKMLPQVMLGPTPAGCDQASSSPVHQQDAPAVAESAAGLQSRSRVSAGPGPAAGALAPENGGHGSQTPLLAADWSWISAARQAQVHLFLADCWASMRFQSPSDALADDLRADMMCLNRAIDHCVTGLLLLDLPSPHQLLDSAECCPWKRRFVPQPSQGRDATQPLLWAMPFASQITAVLLERLADSAQSFSPSFDEEGWAASDLDERDLMRYVKRLCGMLKRSGLREDVRSLVEATAAACRSWLKS